MLAKLAARRRQQLQQHLLPRVAPASAAAAAYISSAAAAVHGGAVPASASASVLPDTLDRGSEAYARNAAAVAGLLSDLRARVSQVLRGGGPEAVKRNAARGKLLPRDRIDRLLDPGASFLELSQICRRSVEERTSTRSLISQKSKSSNSSWPTLLHTSSTCSDAPVMASSNARLDKRAPPATTHAHDGVRRDTMTVRYGRRGQALGGDVQR